MSVELGVVVGIVLAVATVLALVLPLRTGQQAQAPDLSARADLLARRESALQVLRDLDSDFEAGKLSEEDYRPMRVQSLAQAAEILAQLDAAQPPTDAATAPSTQPAPNGRAADAPAAAPARRKRARAAEADRFCPRCGAGRGPDDQFCRKCGKPLT